MRTSSVTSTVSISSTATITIVAPRSVEAGHDRVMAAITVEGLAHAKADTKTGEPGDCGKSSTNNCNDDRRGAPGVATLGFNTIRRLTGVRA